MHTSLWFASLLSRAGKSLRNVDVVVPQTSISERVFAEQTPTCLASSPLLLAKNASFLSLGSSTTSRAAKAVRTSLHVTQPNTPSDPCSRRGGTHLDALVGYAPAQVVTFLQRALGRLELANIKGGHLRNKRDEKECGGKIEISRASSGNPADCRVRLARGGGMILRFIPVHGRSASLAPTWFNLFGVKGKGRG